MGAGGWSIRKALRQEAAGILECLRLAFEPYRARYSPEAYEDTVLSAEALAQRLAEMTLFVAMSPEGEVVGTIGYYLPASEEAHVRGMAVRPDELGRGVAQRLLETVEDEARARGCTRVSLDTTEPLERAIRFYERNGFRRTGVVHDFFGMKLIEYVKSLDRTHAAPEAAAGRARTGSEGANITEGR